MTEEQVRQWAREEYDKKKEAEQDGCQHLVSGSMRDGVVHCDTCGKGLSWRASVPDRPSPVEQRGIDAMRRAR